MLRVTGLFLLGLLMPVSVFAGAESSSMPKTVAQQRSFSQPQVFRGQLGGKLIEMHLQPKKEEPESLEGYYLIGPDWKKKVLLAGEWSGSQVSLEESENGTDVSGTLEAEWLEEGLSGNWMPADETLKLYFRLQPAKQAVTGKRKS